MIKPIPHHHRSKTPAHLVPVYHDDKPNNRQPRSNRKIHEMNSEDAFTLEPKNSDDIITNTAKRCLSEPGALSHRANTHHQKVRNRGNKLSF